MKTFLFSIFFFLTADTLRSFKLIYYKSFSSDCTKEKYADQSGDLKSLGFGQERNVP